MKIPLLIVAGLLYLPGFSQNAGPAVNTVSEKLPVGDTTKTKMQTISTDGNRSVDLHLKSNPDGQLNYRKVQPGLGVHYIIALEGAFPSQGSPQSQGPLIGEIKIFTGGNAPFGWAFCQGQLLSTTTYPALFTLIGTTYGGDGRKSFALPDLRGAVPVGVSAGGYLGERSN